MPLISRMVRKKTIGFGIISREEEQQGGSTGATSVCALPESSCTRSRPQAALCEMECEMSAFNIPAVDYTVRVMLRRGFESYNFASRDFCPGLALAASQSPFNVRQTPPPDWPIHSTMPLGIAIR